MFVPPVSFCHSLEYSNNTEGKLSAALQNREACNASSGTPNRDVDWLLTPCFWSTAWHYSVVSAHSDQFLVSMAKTAYGATGALSTGLQSSESLHWVSCRFFQEISFTILIFVCYSARTFVKEVSGGGEPNPKPLHILGDEQHISDLQERGGFRGRGIKPESQQGGQIAVHGQVSSPIERQGSQESNAVFPSYLDATDRHFATEWIQPKREVLHGWDNFAELAFDMANLLHKPDNPAIPLHDIDDRDYEDLVGKHLPADEWEGSVIGLLEHRGLDFKIPQFREDMQEYRKAVKIIVQLWRERGLL